MGFTLRQQCQGIGGGGAQGGIRLLRERQQQLCRRRRPEQLHDLQGANSVGGRVLLAVRHAGEFPFPVRSQCVHHAGNRLS